MIFFVLKHLTLRSVAQSGSASALGAEGREFESLHSDHFPLLGIEYHL